MFLGMDVLASTYMDPTPVARYTVSAEVLEGMSEVLVLKMFVHFGGDICLPKMQDVDEQSS